MRKLFTAVQFLLAIAALNAQTLDDIIVNYTRANKLDKIAGFKTIRISATTSMMGMNIPMEMWMKNPDKIKTLTSINGQKMVQVFDGEKGYMINPMTGSTVPVEMTADQLKSAARNNLFNNYLAEFLKEGKLTLEGEENVNGRPAFKVKASLDGSNSAVLFIDKSTYLILKTVTDVNQGGTVMSVETFPSDYKEINSIFLPMKTITSSSGMEIVTIFTKVEVDVPIDDSVFSVK